MKTPYSNKPIFFPVLSFFLVIMLAGCGQKGPLYLPEPEPAKPPVAINPAPESLDTSVKVNESEEENKNPNSKKQE